MRHYFCAPIPGSLRRPCGNSVLLYAAGCNLSYTGSSSRKGQLIRFHNLHSAFRIHGGRRRRKEFNVIRSYFKVCPCCPVLRLVCSNRHRTNNGNLAPFVQELCAIFPQLPPCAYAEIVCTRILIVRRSPAVDSNREGTNADPCGSNPQFRTLRQISDNS